MNHNFGKKSAIVSAKVLEKDITTHTTRKILNKIRRVSLFLALLSKTLIHQAANVS